MFSPEVLWKFFHSQCGVGCQKHDEKNKHRKEKGSITTTATGKVHRGDRGDAGQLAVGNVGQRRKFLHKKP